MHFRTHRDEKTLSPEIIDGGRMSGIELYSAEVNLTGTALVDHYISNIDTINSDVATNENTDLDVPFVLIPNNGYLETLYLPDNAFFAPILNKTIDILIDVRDGINYSISSAVMYLSERWDDVRDRYTEMTSRIGNFRDEMLDYVSIEGIVSKVAQKMSDIYDNASSNIFADLKDKFEAMLGSLFVSTIQSTIDGIGGLN